MATAKKSAPKKSKVAKKVTPKKTTVTKKAKTKTLKSFKVYQERTPFFSFKVTDQTIYWMILLVLILILGVWIVNIQINLSRIIDDINRISTTL